MKFHRKWTIKSIDAYDGKCGLLCSYDGKLDGESNKYIPPVTLMVGSKLTLDVFFEMEEVLEYLIEQIDAGEIRI